MQSFQLMRLVVEQLHKVGMVYTRVFFSSSSNTWYVDNSKRALHQLVSRLVLVAGMTGVSNISVCSRSQILVREFLFENSRSGIPFRESVQHVPV